ncbi:HIT family protein [Legionella spiritensis]|uniref:Diadenosine tetraphosphate (Ap4A) hydrolase-like HIT family hydrolase n=1 Tax=Legionella spiritensis TaxID=452 RepID=A0A0W0Z4G3_LEGSP|nr:HIT family protein [Legionella spiritensis]KTD64040.1 diadenosine tetraphosphate (Ap4A) hydrolase-like HIT family hydrolase [Legionella spiritensis]SNV37359.1 diadenosine tetraphosphate (Ap4A) hydrolase-like HIT family hydrolase [Legionella spiritensis]
MSFIVDPRIVSTCIELGDWSLSRVFLKNNADYPWLILVPRVDNIQDLDQLPQELQHTLMDEISRLSTLVRDYFTPDKINVATLGNIVSQLHVHVVARFTNDRLWPHGIWQDVQPSPSREENTRQTLVEELRIRINSFIVPENQV